MYEMSLVRYILQLDIAPCIRNKIFASKKCPWWHERFVFFISQFTERADSWSSLILDPKCYHYASHAPSADSSLQPVNIRHNQLSCQSDNLSQFGWLTDNCLEYEDIWCFMLCSCWGSSSLHSFRVMLKSLILVSMLGYGVLKTKLWNEIVPNVPRVEIRKLLPVWKRNSPTAFNFSEVHSNGSTADLSKAVLSPVDRQKKQRLRKKRIQLAYAVIWQLTS